MKIIYRLFQRDRRAGIQFNKKIYAVYFIGLAIMMIKMYFVNMKDSSPKMLDFLSGILAGNKEFSIYSASSIFFIPVEWLYFQMGVVLVNLFYPIHDLKENGVSYLVRSHSRGKWWLSKCAWSIENTICFLLVFYLVIFLLSCILRIPISWQGQDIWGLTMNYSDIGKTAISLLVMPTLYACAISVFVIFLSFLVEPMVTVFILLGMFAMTSYQTIAIIPCTYTMLFRYQRNIMGHCVYQKEGILVFSIITIMSIILGYRVLQRYDICKGRD